MIVSVVRVMGRGRVSPIFECVIHISLNGRNYPPG